ncbi:multicopper oxidase family protein [Granulicella arctica]|uniref:multicopper oxidase family protein n=1 Tax=Granulicella arctica TaxID=940613 RepID=UPI0021DF7D93|nr:multicopper oxidase family protein [Granulicella arctica]
MLALTGAIAASVALPQITRAAEAADFSLEIAPFDLEVAAKKFVKTVAYNQQVPGPLLRMREGQPVTIDVANRSANDEIVHWHGLFLPSAVDGAMEEGTPMITPGGQARYTFTPRPAGFRWYHSHMLAGNDLKKALYSGQHGFLMIEPKENPTRYEQEVFLALHDWNGHLMGSGDGSMNPEYEVSTVNGRVLGFGEPVQVKPGTRVLFHILNASATEQHWIALAGHTFRVVALDGNAVPTPQAVPMLRLAPAERICAVVEMNHPGVWVLGEVRKHVQAAGMGVVIEYAGSTGAAKWEQPERLSWDYLQFGAAGAVKRVGVLEIPLVFTSKFAGHGALDRWAINGRSYPETDAVTLTQGKRYRLIFKNHSADDHPVHLHRHSFELRRLAGSAETQGIFKDVVLVGAGTEVEVEFTADNPGLTLFHCHQQDHMDMGFMMLLRYA